MIGGTLGHYRILDRLGAGGMGEVYRARDTRLERDVALKLLPPAASADPALIQRLEQEARTVAGLRHPNIVTLYSLEEADGRRFLTMEMVPGKTVAASFLDGTPHPEEARRFLRPLADALATAHAAGVVHRDIKPSNVMVADDGRVMLLDFGVARWTRTPDGDRTRMATDPGSLVGTPAYMSPEQIRGEPVDARSDLFSLGILLQEIATGRHPFAARTAPEMMSAILRDPPTPWNATTASADPVLASVLSRCLEKDPRARYAHAGELRAHLDALLAGEAPPVDRGSALERARSAIVRRDWQTGYEHLVRAEAAGPLGGEDLERLMAAAYWTGRLEEVARLAERAFAARRDEGRDEEAGLMAIALESLHDHRGAHAVAAGWLAQAERLLDVPGTRGYGHLVRLRARRAIEGGRELERARAWAEEVLELGRRLGDPELEALGLLDLGRVKIQQGEVDAGFGLIDASLALASGSRVDPDVIGRIYCSMMAACRMVADVKRAAEWSDAALAWCEATGASPYPGICRVHRADMYRRRGRLEEAETLAREAHEQMSGVLEDVAAEAQYEIGEVRFTRGDFEAAEAAFRDAHERGRSPLPGLARLRLAQGKTEAARKLLLRALDEAAHPLDRARLLPAWIDASLKAADGGTALAAVDELDAVAARYGSRAYAGAAAHARGLCLLEAGDYDGAIPLLLKALRARRELDLPLEGAWTRLALGRAYRAAGDGENAALELGAALSTFRKLGAEPAAREAERLLAAC
jgi:tetratricopeptide (TPR) repeat protein